VDFEYSGNTQSVNHLIAHARGPNNHACSDLNFELNLRAYKLNDASDAIQQEEPFKYPKKTEKQDCVGIFKGQIQPLTGRKLETEYREGFAEKNFNNINALKTASNQYQKNVL
jgi:hypothetical protein